MTKNKEIIDCILVGFYELDFHEFAQKQKKIAKYSGSYNTLKTSSVLLGNKRCTYMQLLNTVLKKAKGSCFSLNSFDLPNLSIAYLASFLHKKSYSIEIINFLNSEISKFVDLLLAKPRTVVITTTYYVENEPIEQIIRLIKQYNQEVKIIIGGPRIFNICQSQEKHIQNLVFESIDADIYINDSQGEDTLAKVLSCIKSNNLKELQKVPNIIYKTDRNVFERTIRIIENNNLEENSIDWSIFDPAFFVPTTYMKTAKSCPFSCEFCSHPIYAGSYSFSGLEKIEIELQYLSELGVKNLIFIDDTLNVPLPRFKNLCRMMIRNNFKFNWVSFFRCSDSDTETFDLMQKSGCIGVYLGIESGDEAILRRMNKFTDIKKYKFAIQGLNERGILTLAALIVGFPGETHQSIMNTTNFIQETSPDFFDLQLYYHDPLSPIYQKKNEFKISGSGYAWKHDTMDWRQASEWIEYMLKNITHSSPLPLYSFSIWTIPYLLQNNISIKQIKSFVQEARNLLIKSLSDHYVDASQDIEKMALIFQNENKK
ncbi:MAG: radical SAM protein [Xenococcaceae cyanobacterium MO_188.B29]|nr:radical SAM protein [Xenococcaceae cyanobacterium MO_188.B29]